MNEISFLTEYKEVLVGLHLLGTALGLGGATISDIMFFRFIKDLKISHRESEVLRVLSGVIWLGVAVILMSGLGLFLENSEVLKHSSKFQIKMFVVGVIIVNGFFLNWKISPKLVNISFGKKHKHKKGELHSLRKFAFSMGGISIVSWYTAFVLGMMRGISLDFSTLLLIYFAVLFVVILAGLFMERYIMNK